jgi:hypothetical protein
MIDFGPAAIIGLIIGFMWGIGCSLAILYAIFLGGYRKAVEDSLAPTKSKRTQAPLEVSPNASPESAQTYPLTFAPKGFESEHGFSACPSGVEGCRLGKQRQVLYQGSTLVVPKRPKKRRGL